MAETGPLAGVLLEQLAVILRLDAAGRIAAVAGDTLAVYGVAPEALLGRPSRDLEQAGISSPVAAWQAWELRRPVVVLEVTRTGRRLLTRAAPLSDPGGKELAGVLAAGVDLTRAADLRRTTEQVRSALSLCLAELAAHQRREGQERLIIAHSDGMRTVMDLVRRVAEVNTSVLVLGETGVGKEVVARAIHAHSPRYDGPFVKVNCGAIPETLLESELFGYERGAFTGAEKGGKLGLAQMAHGGTLFLDEVGELPPAVQVKLLHLLQDREFVRVGGTRAVSVDIRIIAATHQDLAAGIRQGRFREDLFYRLNVVPIDIPPLRRRREDIPALVHHFLQRYSTQYGRVRNLSPEAMDCLQNYHWPGNVRELENVVERLVILAQDMVMTVSDLPPEVAAAGAAAAGDSGGANDGRSGAAGHRGPAAGANGLDGDPAALLARAAAETRGVRVLELLPLRAARDAVERQLLLLALEQCRTTVEMADALGIDQSTVVRKLKRVTGRNLKRRQGS